MIQVYYISKYYGGTTALEDIHFDIRPGEIIGLAGPNGSGKSTLLKALAGMTRPSYGSVMADGRDVRQTRSVSYAADTASHFPSLTVAEHGDFHRHLSAGFDSRRFRQLTGFFQLPGDLAAGRLSRGQQAHLETAICLSRRADLFVMDEPFMGSDLPSRQAFVRLLAGLADERTSLVLATHHVQDIEHLISRILLLDKGRLVADHLMDDLQARSVSLSDLFLPHLAGYSDRLEQILKDTTGQDLPG